MAERLVDPSPPALPGSSLALDEGGLAWLAVAPAGPGLPGADWLRSLEGALDEVEEGIVSGGVRALAVRLRRAAAEAEADGGAALARTGQRALRRLEELPIPTVAALDGAWLGSAAALALACAYRVAADAPGVGIGFPEIRSGLVPALGATVRLPRLVGLQAALELVLSGRAVPAREAQALGLVDELYPAREFADRVRGFARERLERGRIRTGARRGVRARLLEDTAPGRRLILRQARRRFVAGAEGAGATARRALELLAEGVALPLERAFQREAELLGELIADERVQAQLYARRVVIQAGEVPAPERPIERVGVLGAGDVGSDLAYLLASGGVAVRLRDERRAALTAGVRRALGRLAVDVQARRIPEEEADRRAERLAGGVGWGGYGTLDLVVAAVGGELEPTREALREAEGHTREECLLGFTGPGLSTSRVQEALDRADAVIGIHPCHPSDQFRVLELVPGERTAAAAVAACAHLARRLGHVPLVVPDRPGGVANRLLALYLAEATRLVEEGAAASQVDRAAEDFGFALGPLRRLDAMGLERAARLLRHLADGLGERFRAAPVLQRLAARHEDFYVYRGGRIVGENPALPQGITGDAEYLELLRDRLLLALINEAMRIVDDPTEITTAALDVAALLGLGFPRSRGGLLYHAERLGAARLLALLEDYARRFGERYAPAPHLLRLAAPDRALTGQAPASALSYPHDSRA